MRTLMEGATDRTVLLFGSDVDPDPELTHARGITLICADKGETPQVSGSIGVVGWSHAGLEAFAFAADHPGVDRLVLIATPIPGVADVPEVTAKTLLLFGARDPLTAHRAGSWWQKRLPHARLEMVPDGGHDLLTPTWKRTLSHLAPGITR